MHAWNEESSIVRECEGTEKDIALPFVEELRRLNVQKENEADIEGVCCRSGILAPSQRVMSPLSFMHCLYVNSFKNS